MDKKSDMLIASLLYVTKRNWPAITDFWKKSFKFDLSEDVIAMSNFSMGVLTSFVVQSPNEMRLNILQSLRNTFGDEAAELEVILRKYEDAWKQPAKLAARYSVPPLEWEHEALAIVFVDSVEWRATQMIGGQEFYNLFLIGAIGGTISRLSVKLLVIGSGGRGHALVFSPVRGGIFVEPAEKDFQAPSGATSAR